MPKRILSGTIITSASRVRQVKLKMRQGSINVKMPERPISIEMAQTVFDAGRFQSCSGWGRYH